MCQVMVYCFSMENGRNILWQRGYGRHAVETLEHRQLYDVAKVLVDTDWRIYVGHRTIQILGEIIRIIDNQIITPCEFHGEDHFHIKVRRQRLE